MSFNLGQSSSVCFSAARNIVYLTSRSISHASWKGKAAYKAGSAKQQYCIDLAFEAADVFGFNKFGAHEGEIAGGFHNHPPDGNANPWLTIQYRDAEGRIVYHKKADGSTWDRFHVYRDLSLNHAPRERPVNMWAAFPKKRH